MTIADLTKKILAYWWIIIITCVGFGLLLFPWTNETQYVGTLTINANFNNPSLSSFEGSQEAYVDSFEMLLIYMERRFSTIDVQKTIADEAGINSNSLSIGSPFYNVESLGAGSIQLLYSANSQEEAEGFIRGAKIAYQGVVADWNLDRQDEFTIIASDTDELSSSVVKVDRPIQFQILPIVSGLLIGIFVVAILPLPKTKKESK